MFSIHSNLRYVPDQDQVFYVTSYYKPFNWLNGYSRNGVEYLCSDEDILKTSHFVVAPNRDVAKCRARELTRDDVKAFYGVDVNAHIYLQRCKLCDT